MRMFQLVNHEGFIAQYRYDWIEKDRPVQVVELVVSDILVEAHNEWLLGKIPWQNGRNFATGIVSHPLSRQQTIVDTLFWRRVLVETPIKRPRDGKEYGYEWRPGISGGGWEKVSFPRCVECGHYHNPEWPACSTCGYCHKVGKKCGA